MRTETVTLYKFSELSDKAKEHAFSDYRASAIQFFGADLKKNFGLKGYAKLAKTDKFEFTADGQLWRRVVSDGKRRTDSNAAK